MPWWGALVLGVGGITVPSLLYFWWTRPKLDFQGIFLSYSEQQQRLELHVQVLIDAPLGGTAQLPAATLRLGTSKITLPFTSQMRHLLRPGVVVLEYRIDGFPLSKMHREAAAKVTVRLRRSFPRTVRRSVEIKRNP